MPTNVISSLMVVNSGAGVAGQLEGDGQQSCVRKRKCSSSESAGFHSPTEILLNPEILLSLQGGYASASDNPLLEFCLDGGLLGSGGGGSRCRKLPRKSTPRKDFTDVEEPIEDSFSPSLPTTYSASSILLLRACSSSSDLLDSEKLISICQTESCDINVQNQWGDSAIHLLLKGCLASSFTTVFKCLKILLDFDINVHLRDSQGNTALHVLKELLTRNMMAEAKCLALLLLEAGLDVNAVNYRGRTLLSFAVGLPSAETFVRFLLEAGALIWPSCSNDSHHSNNSVERLIQEREESAFTWFVKSSISHRTLTPGHLKILTLLCHSMSDELPDPSRLKRRVLSTLIHLGRSTRVMGPTFSELKRIISPFWTQPLPLKYLCKRKIRKSIGGGVVPRTLLLPKSLRDYLELERSDF